LGPFFLSTAAERVRLSGAHCERAISSRSRRSVMSAFAFLGFFLGTDCLI
jgi:hypothetical protein